MSTTYGATGLAQTDRIDAARLQLFQEILGCVSRMAQTPRGYEPTLCDLSDRELMDIGTTRGEIDYVASNRDIDPRGIRSAG